MHISFDEPHRRAQSNEFAAGLRLGLGRLMSTLGLALVINLPAGASELTRRAEIDSCQPGEITTWPDGHDRPAARASVQWVYRHAGAPAWFSEALVVGSLQRAAGSWSRCGIPTELITEEMAPRHPSTTVIVQWHETETRGNFALADVGLRRLSLSAGMFQLLATRNPRHPAAQTLQMTLSHEMGHFFGLMAHSRRCIDVMSYYDNGRGETCITRDGGSPKAHAEYRSMLPTACDIARCRAVNGLDR